MNGPLNISPQALAQEAMTLQQKLAAGLQGLVMDVKTGNGAFAASHDMARQLARSLVRVANGAGLPTRAWITDMNQVLGDACGNALEVAEAEVGDVPARPGRQGPAGGEEAAAGGSEGPVDLRTLHGVITRSRR